MAKAGKKAKQTRFEQEAVAHHKTINTQRYPDIYFEYFPNMVVECEQLGQSEFVFRSNNKMTLQVSVASPSIFRFHYAITGEFDPDFSYATVPLPDFEGPITCQEKDKYYQLRTDKLICHIHKNDMRIKLLDAKTNKVIQTDAKPFQARATILNGIEYVKIVKKAPRAECYFGLGDKTCSADLRGNKVVNWNTDSFAFDKDSDPLYRTIPFYYGVNKETAYGVFFHNTWRIHFDFDIHNCGEMAFWAEGGDMDYYFIYGPEMLSVAQQYHQLTGTPEMPPMWALGFHQCRWSYSPESRVRELARQFRENKIPCDAIYLDIDYMDGYRCFTWDTALFPEPAKMIADLKADGFQTVVMIDPGIRIDEDYWVYRDGLEKGMFCKRTSGKLMTGPVWPPDCVFPDFTSPKVREWWGQLYRELYVDQGVSGFWNDMNEPAVFKVNLMTFPDAVFHDFDGLTSDHRRAHNVYGQQMSRASYEGIKQMNPGKRPFLLTRSSFAGGQRFAAVWTGDNIASWEHLRLANLQCQRLSISGFSFVGSDIGGFKNMPDGELLVRWLQLGVFHPFFRIHSMGNNIDGAAETETALIKEKDSIDRLDQEPWSFGEPYTTLARKAIQLRYRLLPYLYTAFYQNHKFGKPILKNLAFVDQVDSIALKREKEFLFGDHLLVAPVLESALKSQMVYFPAGHWFDFFDGTDYLGRKLEEVKTKVDRPNLYVRAGAVIPLYPVQQYTGAFPIESVRLRLFHGAAASEWYVDGGEGYDYQKEDYLHCRFTTKAGKKYLELIQERKGNFRPAATNYSVTYYGIPFSPKRVMVDKKIIHYQLSKKGALKFVIPIGFSKLTIE